MNAHLDHVSDRKSWWRTRTGWILIAFLAIAGFFFVTVHRADVLGALPYILLLLCPLLHFFGHDGHGKGEPGDKGHHRASAGTGS